MLHHVRAEEQRPIDVQGGEQGQGQTGQPALVGDQAPLGRRYGPAPPTQPDPAQQIDPGEQHQDRYHIRTQIPDRPPMAIGNPVDRVGQDKAELAYLIGPSRYSTG